ncbi:GntR family transcriptional regulator [Solitalea sp. MAHUQ-68]|uniref:GntR family transcriptional regulator n=1 Tax=Solitalea agri TaxID=2953739 RepID=A0A9X2JEI3_9SPHI|nr:substrate-binding domain-containing protein [Solitalea agri]MCO4293980.1 GntR family transcriptional regulator [Solitalea agri]
MKNIFDKIHKLEEVSGYSKHERLVQGFIDAIDEKLLRQGDLLPSVNSMIKETGFARETIVKGYKELIERGIVESKNRMGYFVASENTNQKLTIALILYAFDSVQETFYNAFRAALDPSVHIDIFFHNHNIDIFETIVNKVAGRYATYIIAPMPHPRIAEILQAIPLNKFLMIDRYEQIAGDFSYVVQEFEQSTYQVLMELHNTIKQFDELVFFSRPPDSDSPQEILASFKKFVADQNIKHDIKTKYIAGSIEKGKVYFSTNDTQTWMMLKDCKEQNLILGKDVGILSQDDDPIKEIICDGITTYSTDFVQMAKKAAHFVLTKEKVREVIPTALIRRKSL